MKVEGGRMMESLRRCTKIPLQTAHRPLPTAFRPLTPVQFHRIVRLLLIPVTSSELLFVRLYRLPMLYPTDG